jgi:hypothetical protein
MVRSGNAFIQQAIMMRITSKTVLSVRDLVFARFFEWMRET